MSSTPAEKLARRVDQLVAGNHDTFVTIHVLKIEGVMYLQVGDGRVERLGVSKKRAGRIVDINTETML